MGGGEEVVSGGTEEVGSGRGRRWGLGREKVWFGGGRRWGLVVCVCVLCCKTRRRDKGCNYSLFLSFSILDDWPSLPASSEEIYYVMCKSCAIT